jgi:hypothetical protein
MDEKPRRRWFRFGLRSLCLLILIIAMVCGWIVYRHRSVSLEMRAIGGHWGMFTVDGNRILWDGKVMTIDFSDFSVNPFQEPRWLDIHSPGGKTTRAIYPWDGDEILLTAAPPGDDRPTALILTRNKPEPDLPPSITTFRLRRIND